MIDTDGRIKLLNFYDKYCRMGILNTLVQEPLKYSLWLNILPKSGDPIAKRTKFLGMGIALLLCFGARKVLFIYGEDMFKGLKDKVKELG